LTPALPALITEAAARLLAAGIETARLDAELLAAHILGTDRLSLLTGGPASLTDNQADQYRDLVSARAARQPLAYLTGVKEFWSLDIKVTPDTLIPRPDSEILVAAVLETMPAARTVLDMGTGSGALLIAVLTELQTATGLGTDTSNAALQVARDNAAAHGLTHRARFRYSDWYQALDGRKFDVILSNPPYIRADDFADLQADVRDYEPRSALVGGGADGLDDYRRIVLDAPAYLAEGGMLAVEIGYDQADQVTKVFGAAGFADIQTLIDLAGHPRVVLGRR